MIIARTPVRICFTGGGTDVRDFYKSEFGAVVTCTISRYVNVIVNRRFDSQLRVATSSVEMAHDAAAVSHPLVREALLMTGATSGLDVLTLSDVPEEGVGLGSSSALIVGLLNALFALQSHEREPAGLAEMAATIEIERLGGFVGKLDQYATALGGLKYIQFNPDDSVYWADISLGPEKTEQLDTNLLLFYTGNTRSASAVMAEQKGQMQVNAQSLRELRDQSVALRDELMRGNISAVGHILHETWVRKRTLSRSVSSTVIDRMYALAREAGALGGKLVGAGGGGFFLVYCEPDYQPKVRQALSAYPELEFSLDPRGTRLLRA